MMRIQKQGDAWWIVEIPGREATGTECGPYRTKAEAAGDMQGLKRFFQDLDEQPTGEKSHDSEPAARTATLDLTCLPETRPRPRPRRGRRSRFASNQ
jgi:hypothetical protein